MQTSYSQDMTKGIKGGLVDRPGRIEGGFSAEVALLFGAGLVKGTNPKDVNLPSANGQVFRGVAVRTHTVENSLFNESEPQYEIDRPVNVLRKGRIWVKVTADVQADEPAYVDRLTAGEIGNFTNVDAVSTDENIATGGVFRTAALSGELAQLEISLP